MDDTRANLDARQSFCQEDHDKLVKLDADLKNLKTDHEEHMDEVRSGIFLRTDNYEERHQGFQKEFKEYRLAMEHRLGKLNELRKEVIEDRAVYMRQDTYSAQHEPLLFRVNQLEIWQARLVGIGIVVVLISGLIGAVLERAFLR